jgi:hypothetical protein
MSWKTNPWKPREILKNRRSDSLKKSQLPLPQGMLKKGDAVDDADDDDEVRISESQNSVNSSSGLSIYSSSLISAEIQCGGGRK